MLNPPTNDLPNTDQPTTYSPTHRPTDPILTDPTDKILFKRLDNRKISILQITNPARKMLNCILWSIIYLMNNIGVFVSLNVCIQYWNILWTYVRFDELIGTTRMVSIYGRKYDVMFKYIEINSSGQDSAAELTSWLYHKKPVTDFN